MRCRPAWPRRRLTRFSISITMARQREIGFPYSVASSKEEIEAGNDSTTDYSKLPAPASPTPSKSLSAYVGTYRNNYYGQIEFSEHRGSLWMRFPDTGALYTLKHWDGNTFTYRFEAEQSIG